MSNPSAATLHASTTKVKQEPLEEDMVEDNPDDNPDPGDDDPAGIYEEPSEPEDVKPRIDPHRAVSDLSDDPYTIAQPCVRCIVAYVDMPQEEVLLRPTCLVERYGEKLYEEDKTGDRVKREVSDSHYDKLLSAGFEPMTPHTAGMPHTPASGSRPAADSKVNGWPAESPSPPPFGLDTTKRPSPNGGRNSKAAQPPTESPTRSSRRTNGRFSGDSGDVKPTAASRSSSPILTHSPVVHSSPSHTSRNTVDHLTDHHPTYHSIPRTQPPARLIHAGPVQPIPFGFASFELLDDGNEVMQLTLDLPHQQRYLIRVSGLNILPKRLPCDPTVSLLYPADAARDTPPTLTLFPLNGDRSMLTSKRRERIFIQLNGRTIMNKVLPAPTTPSTIIEFDNTAAVSDTAASAEEEEPIVAEDTAFNEKQIREQVRAKHGRISNDRIMTETYKAAKADSRLRGPKAAKTNDVPAATAQVKHQAVIPSTSRGSITLWRLPTGHSVEVDIELDNPLEAYTKINPKSNNPMQSSAMTATGQVDTTAMSRNMYFARNLFTDKSGHDVYIQPRNEHLFHCTFDGTMIVQPQHCKSAQQMLWQSLTKQNKPAKRLSKSLVKAEPVEEKMSTDDAHNELDIDLTERKLIRRILPNPYDQALTDGFNHAISSFEQLPHEADPYVSDPEDHEVPSPSPTPTGQSVGGSLGRRRTKTYAEESDLSDSDTEYEYIHTAKRSYKRRKPNYANRGKTKFTDRRRGSAEGNGEAVHAPQIVDDMYGVTADGQPWSQVEMVWVQCDKCGKWRVLPPAEKGEKPLPARWFCYMNPDTEYNKCSSREQTEEEVAAMQTEEFQRERAELLEAQALQDEKPSKVRPSPRSSPRRDSIDDDDQSDKTVDDLECTEDMDL